MLSQPTSEWGPKLQIHRIETHSPKHTDSQVPLASHYDPDNDSNDSDFCNSTNKKCFILPEEPSDSDAGIKFSYDFNETGV